MHSTVLKLFIASLSIIYCICPKSQLCDRDPSEERYATQAIQLDVTVRNGQASSAPNLSAV